MIGTVGSRVPARQVTTRNLGAAYPFIAEAGLGAWTCFQLPWRHVRQCI
jgi:hypothetical protein